jgi:hypothetical protein
MYAKGGYMSPEGDKLPTMESALRVCDMHLHFHRTSALPKESPTQKEKRVETQWLMMKNYWKWTVKNGRHGTPQMHDMWAKERLPNTKEAAVAQCEITFTTVLDQYVGSI